MAGPESVEDVAVVFAALIGVFDQKANRRAGSFAFINAREDFDSVRLAALGDVPPDRLWPDR